MMSSSLTRLCLPWVSFAAVAAQSIPTEARSADLASPDGHLKLTFTCDGEGLPRYTFQADGRTLINPSPLGLAVPGQSAPATLTILSNRTVDSVWKLLWGKRAEVPDRFNEVTLDLKEFRLVARAYDDGVAFRYESPPTNATAELTRFNFAGDYTAWFYNGEHPNLGPEKLSDSAGRRLPVMTIKVDDACYLALHEADLAAGDPLVLESKKGETAFAVASKPSPAWRVILFGHSPGALVDSHLIELLNPPPDPGLDFSWVKPGVAVWDWRINGAQVDGFKYEMSLPSWKRMVDFASQNGIRYLVLDADWYGPEFGKDSDPTKGGKAAQVREIIAYGKGRGVGVWLYLNDVGGRHYPLEQTLKQYADWGAAGVKYGFMSGSPAEKNRRTRLITALCATNHLLCDFHDGPVHPYGQMRTWPNALTREFCHSQLDAHRVFQPKTFVTTVFVNMLAGPLDMCNGLADLTQAGRVDQPSPVPSTLVGEAARTLIVFSGATVIPDIPENYRKHPELLQFIAAEKMPWRDSRTLSGVIGEHIVVARQAADGAWLVGAATNEDPRELDIPLAFLGAGKWDAMILQDGEDSDYRTHRENYKAAKRPVTRADTVHLKLAPGGGACVLLTPAV
jgi:alpha-glucosidase